MNIKAKALKIRKTKPFSEDKLDREESIEILTKFLKSVKEDFVISIESPWGTGKTTFIDMWSKYLEKSSFVTIYYNAWKSDFIEDPMVALLGELSYSIENIINKRKKPDIKGKLEKVIKDSAPVLKRLSNIIVKLGTGGILEGKDLEMLTPEEQVTASVKMKKDIETFKKSLKELKSEISRIKPIIIFVDEIDRCLPEYAIRLLERIKHFFNIPGIIFVLAVDKDQLFQSIKELYGEMIEVDGYLRRIIDIGYLLPKPNLQPFVESLFERFNLNTYFPKNSTNARDYKTTLITMFVSLAELFNLSLRDIEHCFTLLSIVLKVREIDKLHVVLLSFLIVLRIKKSLMYKDIVTKNIKLEEVMESLEAEGKGDYFVKDASCLPGVVVEAYLALYLYDKDKYKRPREKYNNIMNNQKSSNFDKERAKAVFDQIIEFQRFLRYDLLGSLSKSIEILDHFREL